MRVRGNLAFSPPSKPGTKSCAGCVNVYMNARSHTMFLGNWHVIIIIRTFVERLISRIALSASQR